MRKTAALLELNRGTDPARIISCNSKPDPPAPCDNKTAHVAYLVVANKSDKIGGGLNDGSYFLEIQVTGQDIQPDENYNPVKTLRTRYSRWVKDRARRGRSKSH